VIAATARTIVGRRGTFLSTVALAFLSVIAVAVIRAIVNARDPETHPSIGGAIFVEGAGGMIFFVGILGGVLMGALAGSYDAAQGTMRYLVMTGVSRMRIYASRAVALLLCVFVALLPAIALMLVLAVVLPQPDGAGIDGHDLAAALWGIALFSGVYALVSLGIGSLLRSNGAAIAISLLINFALTPVIFLIASWSERVASFALPVALGTLTGDDTTEISIGMAAVAVVAWLALFLGAGWARIARDEY
jgi:ABC-type transport system involved in multi-copper enzyme maturation permease subunit